MEIAQYYTEENELHLLNEQLKNLSDYGNINRADGSFEFNRCLCGGPLLGHKIKCDEGCEQLSNENIKMIDDWLENYSLFIDYKNKLDDRIAERICSKCNSVFENRFKAISHHRSFHKDKNYGLQNFDSKYTPSLIDERIEKIVQCLEKQNITSYSRNPAHYVKSKKVPTWVLGQDIDSFCRQLVLWDKQCQLRAPDKYFEIIESLKSNTEIDGLKAFTAQKIIDNDDLEIDSEKIVSKIVEILQEQYGKSRIEKIDEIEVIMTHFMKEKITDPKEYVKKFELLLSKLGRSKINVCEISMLLCVMFVKHSSLNEMQIFAIRKIMENTDEKILIPTIIKEYNKMIINTIPTSAENILYSSSSYVRRSRSRSRGRNNSYGEKYQNFQKIKNRSQDRDPDFRKNQNHSQERARSFSRDRQRSFSRNSSFNKDKDQRKSNSRNCQHKCSECEKQEVTNNQFVSVERETCEVLIENIFFSEECKIDELIIDSGAPKNIVGRKWLEDYISANNFEKGQIIKQSAKTKKFRFGPSKIFQSSDVYEIPIILKGNSPGTEFNILRVKVYVLDTEIPFLISKEQLQFWSATQNFCKNREQLIIKSFRPNIVLDLLTTCGDHLAIKLERNKQYTEAEIVNFVQKSSQNEDITECKSIKKVHQMLGHAGETTITHFYKNADRLSNNTRKNIKKVIQGCEVCTRRKKSLGIPKVSAPKVTEFNQTLNSDLKVIGNKYILWMVDAFTRFIAGVVLKDKEAKTVVSAIIKHWCQKYGFPSESFYQDNGSEFQNTDLESLASQMNLNLKYGPCYSPWSNGTNERNHYSADRTVSKLMDADKTLNLEDAVSAAAWTHNVSISKNGYSPMQLVTGRRIVLPGIVDGNIATESFISDSEAVRNHINLMRKSQEEFMKIEYGSKLKLAENSRVSCFNNFVYHRGDLVFYQENGTKQWHGPAEVFEQVGRTVWIHANGKIRKIASCHVHPKNVEDVIDRDEKLKLLNSGANENIESKDIDFLESHHEEKTHDETGLEKCAKTVVVDSSDPFLEGKILKEPELFEVRPKRGSHVLIEKNDENQIYGKVIDVNKSNSINKHKCWVKTCDGTKLYIDFESEVKDWKYVLEKNDDNDIDELQKDKLGAYYLNIISDESFSDATTIYAIEIPKKSHKEPEVMEAKEIELANFKTHNAIVEVKDTGQIKIGSRWVVTEKERQDGQKKKVKARLVVRGFQEQNKPQSDSPTALRDSFKSFIAISCNFNFKIHSVDISAAFLQSENLDREIYVEPPNDIKVDGFIWKLNKPIYGLDDASRKFWLKVDSLLKEKGLKTMPGDPAFYYSHKNGTLNGMILIHVDDFLISGFPDFNEKFLQILSENFVISKIETSNFRFCGIDITQSSDSIEINMTEYVDHIPEVEEIRNVSNSEELSKVEIKVFRKLTGKIQWLSDNVRPDLAFMGLKMSTKNNSATIGDLKQINRVVKKIKEIPSKIIFRPIDKKENLLIYGFGDASYKCDEKSIGGVFIVLGSKVNDNVSPLYYKSKTIAQVCHSAKSAETRNMVKLADESLYLANMIKILLHGENSHKKVDVKLFTDSRSTLESIASSKQVEQKLMRNSVAGLKDFLINLDIKSYSWLDKNQMVADVLTKETKENKDLSKILLFGKSSVTKNEDNIVFYKNNELKIENIKSKN